MTFFKVFDPKTHSEDLIEKYDILHKTNEKVVYNSLPSITLQHEAN